MLKINLSRESEKFLKKLPPKQGKQIARKLTALRENPKPNDAKSLKNSPYLRADIGEYRIIYSVEGEVIKIFLIGKRNDDEVYKKFKRKRH